MVWQRETNGLNPKGKVEKSINLELLCRLASKGHGQNEKLAICVDSVGGFCMGDSSLLDGRGKYFGREDYWYSNPVGDGRNVHNNYHIHAYIDVTEIQEIFDID